MTHSKHAHSHSEERKDDSGPRDAYWMRAHKDWKFWTAVMLMLAAMGVYITTLDLAVAPGPQEPKQVQQPVP